jgi:hypothetical protein
VSVQGKIDQLVRDLVHSHAAELEARLSAVEKRLSSVESALEERITALEAWVAASGTPAPAAAETKARAPKSSPVTGTNAS